MGALSNAFALLADQQGKEASTIVALKTAQVQKIVEKQKKIAEEKKKAEAKKKKKSCARVGGGTEKEGHADAHAQETLDVDAVDNQRSEPSDGSDNCNDQADSKEHKAVTEEKVLVRTAVLSEEELEERWLCRERVKREEEAQRMERWLAREAEREERWLAREAALAREAERRARRLAREAGREERGLAREEERKKEIEERRKKEMAMKTLQEYEEHKAYEKHKADKVSLSAPLREADLDTKQNSKDETVKKYSKVRKTMNIEEFLKLPTGGEGQDGPVGGNQEYTLQDENNTEKGKAGLAPDLSETSFPVLGEVTKPKKVMGKIA